MEHPLYGIAGMVAYEDRKKIFDTIKLLVQSEQEEVFRIIRKTKENYTENSNGIFFDISKLTIESFEDTAGRCQSVKRA